MLCGEGSGFNRFSFASLDDELGVFRIRLTSDNLKILKPIITIFIKKIIPPLLNLDINPALEKNRKYVLVH